MELTAQILGVIASVVAIVSYQLKKNWQIFGFCAIANFFSGMSFLFLGNAGVMMANSFAAVIQCLINAFRAYFGKKGAGNVEKIIAFFVFLGIGIVQTKGLLDLLPLAAVMLFVLSTFQKNEQKIRIILFFNALILLIYTIILGSSLVIGHTFSLISLVSAYIRERKAGMSE